MKRINQNLKITFFLLAAAAFANDVQAQSQIDPVAGSYRIREYEPIGSRKIQRVYSSQSTYRGVFGLGWCSDLDGRIDFYDNGEMRFIGCNPQTATTLDPRGETKTIKLRPGGYSRIREDGAVQIFSSKGLLVELRGQDGRFILEYANRGELVAIRIGESAKRRLVSTGDRLIVKMQDDRIIQIGNQPPLVYSGQLLVSAGARIYRYDENLNLTFWRNATGERQEIRYAPDEDRVVAVWRVAKETRDRLIVTMSKSESGQVASAKVEMRIETERGAEMHPARILYDCQLKTVVMQGDRTAARRILEWI